MPLPPEALEEIVRLLARRPGHEQVRVNLCRLLVDELGVAADELAQEVRIELRSRIDTLLGDTVFEIKSDLRKERQDAESQLARYLANREAETGRRFVGVAADGATFDAYELRDGVLTRLSGCLADTDQPRALPVWLESVTALAERLPADALTVVNQLGRQSAAFARADGVFRAAWERLKDDKEVKLKRQLWSEMISMVYGRPQDDDRLWSQHAFLTIVAKSFVHNVLRVRPNDAADLLTGESVAGRGVEGAVESDFFDWVLKDQAASDVAMRLYAHVLRFDVADVDTDLLKILYESLIDPETRHELGEYYTPDWLADRLYRSAVPHPVSMRMLDPSCGSGTFLFHGVRGFLQAARTNGWPEIDLAEGCVQKVFGIDVHPVAVLIARVTYVLALGEALNAPGRPRVSIPVYLGDALQWNVKAILSDSVVEIAVPPAEPDQPPTFLRLPETLCALPQAFDEALRVMLEHAERGASHSAVERALSRIRGVNGIHVEVLMPTYHELVRLLVEGRDHIWGYVLRNLARPVSFSSRDGRPEVVLGNPPWLSYRFMSKPMQTRLKREMENMNIWVGGKLATQQDLSAYFFARCVDRYLNVGMRIAFLMPMATLTRGQFENLRKGSYGARIGVRFDPAWVMDDDVYPLFPVPAAALTGVKSNLPRPLPEDEAVALHGRFPVRNPLIDAAEKRLTVTRGPLPVAAKYDGGSPYRKRFNNGAALYPRLFWYVVEDAPHMLGRGDRIPLSSRRSNLEKAPWKDLPALRGAIEQDFVRPALLGESIAPYRVIDWPTAVIPVDGGTMLDAGEALERGLGVGVHDWLKKADALWRAHGRSDMTLKQQGDYFGKLSAQFPIAPLRVVYAKAGTKLAACVLRSADAVVENGLYWATVESEDEARYLCAVLNSETLRAAAEKYQSRGQWGARHFDKVVFNLPIPRFDGKETLHRRLAALGDMAERLAADVALPDKGGFTAARKAIRSALDAAGIAERIDAAVAELLGM